jgi:hypothetical protein
MIRFKDTDNGIGITPRPGPVCQVFNGIDSGATGRIVPSEQVAAL